MKILTVGDLHGKLPLTKEFLKKEKIDLILCSGDLADNYKIRNLIFKHWKQLKQDKQLYEIVGLKQMQKLILDDVNSQYTVFEKFHSLNMPVFIVMGNGDYSKKVQNTRFIPFRFPYSFESECKNKIFNLNLKSKNVDNFCIIGYPSDETFRTKKELKHAENKLIKLFRNAKKKIFLVHDPPYNTKLDLVRNKISPRYKQHVGSKVVRRIIKKFKPSICICGHMHENQGVINLGETLVVNSGYGGNGQCVLIEINEQIKIKLLKLK